MNYTEENIQGKLFTYLGKGSYFVDRDGTLSLPEGSTKTTWTMSAILAGIAKGEWKEIEDSTTTKSKFYELY